MSGELVKTRAIALRVDPVTNTSAKVEWLGHRFGRFMTQMRGAYRDKSFLLGQFDLFYSCELVLQTTRHGYFHLRECYPLNPRTQLRTNWRAAAVASYLAYLFSSAVPWRAPSKEEFIHLDSFLDHLTKEQTNCLLVYWIELKFLKLMGHQPLFDQNDTAEAHHFDIEKGVFSNRPSATTERQGADVRAILRKLQTTDHPAALSTLKLRASQELQIESLLGNFITYHLELNLEPRRIALNILAQKPAAVSI